MSGIFSFKFYRVYQHINFPGRFMMFTNRGEHQYWLGTHNSLELGYWKLVESITFDLVEVK